MTDAQTAAADRLKDAIKGKIPAAHVQVLAADLSALAGALGDDKHTDTTRTLQAGAEGAVKGMIAARAAQHPVFVVVKDVTALLGAAGANAQ